MARERKFNIAQVAAEAEQTLRPATSITSTEVEQPQTVSATTPIEKETPTRFRGRKKVIRTIEKVNGKTIYFEESVNNDLRNIGWNTQVDQQDIVRVAVNEFLARYAENGALNNEGRNLVVEYIKSTSKSTE